MKHKLTAVFLALFLLLRLPMVAGANDMNLQLAQDEKSEVIASYRTGNKIFSFLHFNGQLPEANKLTLNAREDQRQTAETMLSVWNQGEAEVTLLVDTSAPMAQYHDDLLLFAKSLMSNGPKNLTVSVVAVKDAAEIETGIRDWQTLNAILEGLTYEGWLSDLCGSVARVLDQIGQKNHDNGAMLNLIVFSRCMGYYNNDEVQNTGERSTAASRAAKAIQDHPEIIVHSAYVENSNTVETQTLATGKGHQIKITDSVSATNAGLEIMNYLNDTWTVKFAGYDVGKLPLDDLSIRYQTVEEGISVLHNLPVGIVVDLGATEQETASAERESTEPTLESTAPEDNETTESVTSSDETSAPEGTADPSETGPTGETPTEENNVVAETGAEDLAEKKNSKLPLWIGISAGCVVMLGVIIAILVAASGRKKSGAVVMRAVVEFGSVKVLQDRYYLNKSLIIGSGKDCDIIITGASVSPKNTKIFLDKGNVYVEDMNSELGTLIGGMRIYSPNRLRSGDVVTVGNTSIRFLF